MSLFESFRNRNKEATPTEPNWDSLRAEVPFPFARDTAKATAGDTVEDTAEDIVEKTDTITEITPERSDEILQKTIINGDPFTIKGQDYTLTPEMLKESGLAPQYEFKIGEISIGLSEIFKVQGRDAIIAYVEDEKGEIKARSYYRSKSSGLWRYCPDYGYNDGIRVWFGKGFGEESLTLPYETQKQINSLQRKEGFKPNMPSVCFFGTAIRYASPRDYSRAKLDGELPGDYPKEVAHYPSVEFSEDDGKIPPEQLDIVGDKAPEFHSEITSYQMKSDLCGDYTVRVFPSADKQLLYSMCEIEENGIRKAWIGNIEIASSPIGSTGLRQEWVYPGDIGTPLFEYPSQSGDYGGQDAKDGYVDMWDYLSKSPLIKRYLEETGSDSYDTDLPTFEEIDLAAPPSTQQSRLKKSSNLKTA